MADARRDDQICNFEAGLYAVAFISRDLSIWKAIWIISSNFCGHEKVIWGGGGECFYVFNVEWNVKLNRFNMCSLWNKTSVLQRIGRVGCFCLQRNRFCLVSITEREFSWGVLISWEAKKSLLNRDNKQSTLDVALKTKFETKNDIICTEERSQSVNALRTPVF